MTSERTILVARIVSRTDAEGPGTRFAVWVQGCSVRCDGCFNPQMWGTVGGRAVAVDSLVHEALTADVEGVTLLGGEPFEQAGPLAEFASQVRVEGLSVMTFSGHTYKDLLAISDDNPDVARLLAETDLLVDGPYDTRSPDLLRPWVGSTNQEFRFLTKRYSGLQETLATLPDRIEVRVGVDGETAVNGWASVDALDALLDGLGGGRIKRGSVR